jgi:hypothetical protein
VNEILLSLKDLSGMEVVNNIVCKTTSEVQVGDQTAWVVFLGFA